MLAALALLGGCGSSSSSSSSASSASSPASTPSTTSAAAFKTGFPAAANQLRDTSKAIGRTIQSASSMSDAQLGAAFHKFSSEWQSHVSQLQTLTPPASVQSDFNTVTASANRVTADLNAVVSAAATHDAGAAKQSAASLVMDILAVKAAATAIFTKLGIPK
jgi:hypothetical protein